MDEAWKTVDAHLKVYLMEGFLLRRDVLHKAFPFSLLFSLPSPALVLFFLIPFSDKNTGGLLLFLFIGVGLFWKHPWWR